MLIIYELLSFLNKHLAFVTWISLAPNSIQTWLLFFPMVLVHWSTTVEISKSKTTKRKVKKAMKWNPLRGLMFSLIASQPTCLCTSMKMFTYLLTTNDTSKICSKAEMTFLVLTEIHVGKCSSIGQNLYLIFETRTLYRYRANWLMVWHYTTWFLARFCGFIGSLALNHLISSPFLPRHLGDFHGQPST